MGRIHYYIDEQFFFYIRDISCTLSLTPGTSESIIEDDLARVIHGGIGTLSFFGQGA